MMNEPGGIRVTEVLRRYPGAVRRVIEKALAQDEKLIWTGRAMPRNLWASREEPALGEYASMQVASVLGRVVQEGISIFLSFLLIPIGFAITLYAVLRLDALEGATGLAEHALLLLLGLGLAGAGLIGFLNPLLARLELARTYYLLTSNRALILCNGNGRATRMLRAGASLLTSLLLVALGVAIAGGGIDFLVHTDAPTDSTLGAFLFGTGCLLVIMGSGFLAGYAGWRGFGDAYRSLLAAASGSRFALEMRAIAVDDIDGGEICVKRVNRKGVGDLVFANDNYYDRGGRETAGGGIVEVDVGFLRIEGARELEKVLRGVCAERAVS